MAIGGPFMKFGGGTPFIYLKTGSIQTWEFAIDEGITQFGISPGPGTEVGRDTIFVWGEHKSLSVPLNPNWTFKTYSQSPYFQEYFMAYRQADGTGDDTFTYPDVASNNQWLIVAWTVSNLDPGPSLPTLVVYQSGIIWGQPTQLVSDMIIGSTVNSTPLDNTFMIYWLARKRANHLVTSVLPTISESAVNPVYDQPLASIAQYSFGGPFVRNCHTWLSLGCSFQESYNVITGWDHVHTPIFPAYTMGQQIRFRLQY
jgi:hypothetical protein